MFDWLKHLAGPLAALVPEFVGFSCRYCVGARRLGQFVEHDFTEQQAVFSFISIVI